MRIAQLTIADRSFYLPHNDVDAVMADVASARASGEWLELMSAGGYKVRVLVPSQALVELREFEIGEPDSEPDTNDWGSFDYDF